MFTGVGERTREGNDLYGEMTESGVINKTALVYGQMNEPPGARMRVALSGPVSYTHLPGHRAGQQPQAGKCLKAAGRSRVHRGAAGSVRARQHGVSL